MWHSSKASEGGKPGAFGCTLVRVQRFGNTPGIQPVWKWKSFQMWPVLRICLAGGCRSGPNTVPGWLAQAIAVLDASFQAGSLSYWVPWHPLLGDSPFPWLGQDPH